MRVCMICEGSYPYVPGGVSSWVQMLCEQFSDIEFFIVAIATSRDEMSEYKCRVPGNVTGIRTLYLEDAAFSRTGRKVRLTRDERKTLTGLVSGPAEEVDWTGTLELAKRHHAHLSDLLMSESFFDVCREQYALEDSKKVFLQFLWNYRGIYFPLMHILSQELPEAAIYHAVSAGYAGVLGSSASHIAGKPFLLSEHGIYTREREEDIIRSNWVSGEFKGMWIDFFKKMSFIAYQQASVVTTLFGTNRSLQVELSCPPEKIALIPNGVNAADFDACRKTGEPPRRKKKRKAKKRSITIGAVLRVVPIKDVKTMLLAFDIVKKAEPRARLKIMGNTEEDPVYYRECAELLEELGTPDVEFLGQVNIKEHLPDVDLLLLSSISEGQPLAMLEGMAAEIPFVTTNVGDCKALLEGERADDRFGSAGIAVPVMDSEAMAQAVLRMIRDPEQLRTMGAAGRRRVEKYYTRSGMLDAYRKIYEELGSQANGRDRIRA